MPQKIAIDSDRGMFNLSPEAAWYLHERGIPGIATPVEEYYKDAFTSLEDDLSAWRNEKDPELRHYNTIFSPDEKFVLFCWLRCNVARDNPIIIECIEKFGNKVNGYGSNLKIVEIPDGVEWEINRSEGEEWVAEKHRTWR
jgi:hypothetical protein